MPCSDRLIPPAAWWLSAAVAVVACLAAQTDWAVAVPVASDRFLTGGPPGAYSLGAVVSQNPSMPGFADGWYASTGTGFDIVGTSLSFGGANYPASSGGAFFSPTNNQRIHRLLNFSTNPFQATDSGSVYLSYLYQNTSATANGYLAFEMHDGGNSDGNRTFQLGASEGTGDFPNNATNYGFRVNGQALLSASLGARNTTVNLFLIKFNLSTDAGGDSVRVWHNPTIPAGLVTDPTGGTLISGFDFVADRLGIGRFVSANTFDFTIDELRIGTTLRDTLSNTLSCDFNGNGVCNSSDFAILSQHMYLAGTYEDGDIDGNGTIDFGDYRLFKDHPARVVGLDAPGTGSGEIPEPTSAALVVIGLVGICSRSLRNAGRSKSIALLATVVLGFGFFGSGPAFGAAEDLLDDPLFFSGKTLNFAPFAAVPSSTANIVQMTHKPSDARMYVVTEQGSIYVMNQDASGNTSPALFFNAASAVQAATGRSMHFTGGQQGLQSIAFHPNFERPDQPGYGKLYTTMLEMRPANPSNPAHFYLGNSLHNGAVADGVLAEWDINHTTGQVDANSYRELFRVQMPNYDHPIKLAQFNPYSEPGDDDYGLLYMTHGDSNNQDSPTDDPQDRGDVLGKMLRINPLQSGANRYTIPSSNPFFSSSNPSPTGTAILGEVYAYGFRNPHNFSFNKDDEGDIQILVGDIGRSNIEEINLAVAGGNYGWPKREGTFVHKQGNVYPPNPSPDAGYIYGVSELPGVGPEPDFIYPVAQYDHNGVSVLEGQDFTASSVASGFVIRNGSDPTLHNQYIFHNFSFNHGDIYGTDFDAMLNANTEFETLEGPGVLTQAELFRFHLTLDHDNNPVTPVQESDSLNGLLGVFRNDGRYGEGISGEMYVSSKANGRIYLVTNTLPDDRVTLTVDRGTGEMTISNTSGTDFAVDSVSVFSPSGSLVPEELESVAVGWSPSPYNSAKDLSQANGSGSLVLNGSSLLPLGDAYDAQLVAFGQTAGEDLQFVIETTGPNGRKFLGDVVYTGVSDVPNTIVLTVDVATGLAKMQNQTPFTQEVEGYTIGSDEGSLNTSGWDTLEAQGVDDGDWLASPALATRFTELQEDGTTTFNDATTFALGEVFSTGAEQDLVFEFQLAGEDSLRIGMVTYILAGDYNDDAVVDAADFTVWRDNLGTSERLPNDMTPGLVSTEDYHMWKSNFGATLPPDSGGGSAGGSAVPEPASLAILAAAALALVASRARR